jgi:hypothetical protein
MAIKVSYKDLVNQLEKDLSISFSTYEDPTKVKRKISMAKHRENIEGKLIFSHQPAQDENNKEYYVITAVLTPKRGQLELIKLNSTEGF